MAFIAAVFGVYFLFSVTFAASIVYFGDPYGHHRDDRWWIWKEAGAAFAWPWFVLRALFGKDE